MRAPKINRWSNKGRALHRKMVRVLLEMMAEDGASRADVYRLATSLNLPGDLVGALVACGFTKSGAPRTFVEMDEAFTELEHATFEGLPEEVLV